MQQGGIGWVTWERTRGLSRVSDTQGVAVAAPLEACAKSVADVVPIGVQKAYACRWRAEGVQRAYKLYKWRADGVQMACRWRANGMRMACC